MIQYHKKKFVFSRFVGVNEMMRVDDGKSRVKKTKILVSLLSAFFQTFKRHAKKSKITGNNDEKLKIDFHKN